MVMASPSRGSHRAVLRRKATCDPDQESVTHLDPLMENNTDEFTTSPVRRTRRRVTAEASPTQKTAVCQLRVKEEREIEPSEIFKVEQSVPQPLISPSKQSSPRRRKSRAPLKAARHSVSPEGQTTPAPNQLTSCELPMLQSTPLSDITNAAINEKTISETNNDTVAGMKMMDNVLEKPMDIVVRTRALGVPQMQEQSNPKSRTVIKYLVLTNFKSYAGRQEVGPFHASFSSVVGPNGSGKSNVIDSLLFVFGFRASKMRQSKISALIHNSAAFPDLDYCEVEVHFQEVRDVQGGAHESVPNTDLVISRKAFKNNSSKYYLNARESNFTAVTTLLKDKGVDLDHKRFLILQGEVESIAQMKPKAANEHDDGLLEYLEDIIGTSKYKTPIEESAAEVESLNEVCHEKSARVQHVEKEKHALEDRKNKALSFLQDENELTIKQSALYQVYVEECNDNLNVTQEALREIQAQLDEQLEKHHGNNDGIKSLEVAFKGGQKVLENLEKETQLVLKEMARYEKEKVKYDEKRKFLTGKQKKLDKSLQSTRLSASEVASLFQKYSDDIERNSADIVSLEESMKLEECELAVVRESLKGKTQAFSDQISIKQRQLEPWNEKINQKQSAIAVAQSELEILEERASAGEVALKDLRTRLTSVRQARVIKIAELERLKAEKLHDENDLNSIRSAISESASKELHLQSQISAARQKADEAKASLSASQSHGKVLAGLMRLKESGRIEGFHGRLGNLGTIDEKYDIAISTACPSLENLVVDSVEVGQQCIDYLRKNSLGRANIILLDRLARRDTTRMATPEGVPRLVDLVNAKEDRFQMAFHSVLQNTLVATDLEQANRIAYGTRRWRVVTLDGQLIDVSGAMSGGGSRVARGGMSSKLAIETTKEQVFRLENDRDTLEEQLKTLQGEKLGHEARLRELLVRIPALETQMQKNGLEINSIERNATDLERRIAEIEAEEQTSHASGNQVPLLERQIDQHQKELGKLRAQTSDLEEEIKLLQDKIMEVGGVKLRSQKAKVEGLKEQIDTLAEETSNAEVSRSKSVKDKAKHEMAYHQIQRDLQLTVEELERLESESSDQATGATEFARKAEGAQAALEDKREELDAIKIELSKKTAELNETRAIEIEMKNKLDENQKVLLENQKRLRYWNEKLGNLSIQSAGEFEEDQGEEMQLPVYTKDELLDLNKDTLKAEIAILEEKTQNMNVDLSVLDEYRRRVAEHTSRSGDLQTAMGSRDAAKKRCDDLRKLRLEGFMEGFGMISLRLKEMYQMITMGGNAELELVDSLDPFSEGILFSVMPPKKSWKNISNLSGGEKTLSSLALVFALHHYKPTPLYVMDEIDAALDFRNVSIVASYIRERTKNAQFIVISLRNNMFELASRLVGVYKVNHMTKSVTVENKDYITRQL